jgi:hypothetical protein
MQKHTKLVNFIRDNYRIERQIRKYAQLRVNIKKVINFRTFPHSRIH